MLTTFRDIVALLLEEYKNDIHVRIKPSDKERFRALVSSIVTQNRKGVETTLKNIEKDQRFDGWDPGKFATSVGRDLLTDYVGHGEKVRKICDASESILRMGFDEWVEALKKEDAYIGQKTRDDFLKETGNLNYFPIDRYYPRFLARTGLLSKYTFDTKADPAKFMDGLGDEKCYIAYKDMMINLCESNLKGLKYSNSNKRDFDLSENPGIVDMLIWRHCSAKDSGGSETCAKEPDCPNCRIKTLCEYGKSVTPKLRKQDVIK
jgi:hypothetical protein